jgi:hypothetical protein
MKGRNILVITGIILIFFNLLFYASGNFKLPEGETSYKVGYFIGSSMLAISGLLLLIIGYIRHKKIIRKREKEMMDSFLK